LLRGLLGKTGEEQLNDEFVCYYWVKSTPDFCHPFFLKECKKDCKHYGECGSCKYRGYSIAQDPCRNCIRKEHKKDVHFF
jgi:hypothetical protein